jgi:hypothetical protein
VKTGVTINGLEHIEYLPVMDYRNASIIVDNVTSFDVNKAIQRSLTKAVARHGLGLYIYAGEDLPEADRENKQNELDTACKEVRNAATMQDLESLYHKYENKYKTSKVFIGAVNERKNQLQKAA